MVTIEEIFESYEIKKMFRLTSDSDNSIEYNMYEVEITYQSGKKEIKRLFVESNTINIMNVDEKTRREFMINRLFGKNGLMNEQKRNDFIFLGRLCIDSKGRYETWRDYPLEDATEECKTAKQKFENHLNSIQKALGVEKIAESPKSMKSKNYAISDIHGMYGSYIEAIQQLNPQDNLYIIGDVIDRGENGIKILKDIIKRKQNPETNPSITFLIGNHELMFLENVAIISQYINNYIETHEENNDINSDTKLKDIISTLCRSITVNIMVSELKSKIYYAQKFGENKENLSEFHTQFSDLLEEKVELDKKYKKLVEPLNINPVYLDKLKNWIYYNKGEKTLLDFYSLSEYERNEIYNFLLKSYVILPEEIADKNFLFVHAMPPKEDEMLKKMKEEQVGYTVQDLWSSSNSEIKFMVEERNFETYEKSMQYGFFTICGHTPLVGKIANCPDKGFARIDAGCGHKNQGTSLALYCIDDGKVVKFISEKEDISKKHSNNIIPR